MSRERLKSVLGTVLAVLFVAGNLLVAGLLV